MPRISLVNETDRPDLAPLIADIKAQRGGRFLNLYRTLAHSPGVAAGWLHLFTEIRKKAKLDDASRELAIMRVAVLNGAPYEYAAHVPFALKAGVTQAQLDALTSWSVSDLYPPKMRAVLAYTDAMTREIRVPDGVFAAARAHFDEQEMVELTATIGGYNLVSRFLEAMQVPHEEGPMTSHD
ncbi:MAG: carboxymuconolactone decarboxylase family protein [Burkholderiales bacterium]|nr:carboxymuconolactone decarboxylase family protein [Burkholderiales bacterium]